MEKERMQEKLNIAVFVDYDNIEIGLKSTLRREFDVSLALDALKERGDIVAKFAYANWGRQDGATRQMAENAVQMVQRIPSPRGDKNGADINLALDALEMAFTHTHVNAFAIVSGDSDFIPLVNKLKEYGKTVFVVGGKAFTSTILQQNCHEFISFESLMSDSPAPVTLPGEVRAPRSRRPPRRRGRIVASGRRRPPDRGIVRPEIVRRQTAASRRQRPAPLELQQAMPLVERALQVLERRAVQPQLGLAEVDHAATRSGVQRTSLRSVQLLRFRREAQARRTGATSAAPAGATSSSAKAPRTPERAALKPEDLLPPLRDVLENHRLEIENGCPVEDLAGWFKAEQPNFDVSAYGFQAFSEFLNYAQDKTVVRLEPHEEQGMMLVSLGAEFYPPAEPPEPEPDAAPRKKRRRTSRSLTWKASRPSSSRILRPPSQEDARAQARPASPRAEAERTRAVRRAARSPRACKYSS